MFKENSTALYTAGALSAAWTIDMKNFKWVYDFLSADYMNNIWKIIIL
jgi:hypothetical protein